MRKKEKGRFTHVSMDAERLESASERAAKLHQELETVGEQLVEAVKKATQAMLEFEKAFKKMEQKSKAQTASYNEVLTKMRRTRDHR